MKKAEPNVVPLCDILLVLIIIFMVATPASQAGIDVRIPEKDGIGPHGPIVLTIKKDGLLCLNDETFTTLADLEKRVIDIYQFRNDRTIFVKMHREHSYKYFIQIVDMIKGAGVDRICTYQ